MLIISLLAGNNILHIGGENTGGAWLSPYPTSGIAG
jgi:N-acetylneuraminic acid mutarotase